MTIDNKRKLEMMTPEKWKFIGFIEEELHDKYPHYSWYVKGRRWDQRHSRHFIQIFDKLNRLLKL